MSSLLKPCKEMLVKSVFGDFPGGPVVQTPCFHCRGHGFDSWSGKQDPACHAVWPKKRKEKSVLVRFNTNDLLQKADSLPKRPTFPLFKKQRCETNNMVYFQVELEHSHSLMMGRASTLTEWGLQLFLSLLFVLKNFKPINGLLHLFRSSIYTHFFSSIS